MKVTYIAHSGFLVETKTACLLFDYWKGEIPVMNPAKPLVVFVSHRHHDHYNPAVWKLREQYPLVHYVLGFDIPFPERERRKYGLSDAWTAQRALIARAAKTYEITLENGTAVTIETFLSTDEGVAFYVTVRETAKDSGADQSQTAALNSMPEDTVTIYHAGDLHLWLWEENGPNYIRHMKRDFERITKNLQGRDLDVGFFLLDERLGNTAFAGMDAYLEMMHVRYAFPMHMWKNYALTNRYLEAREDMPQAKALQRVSREGEVFFLPL